MAASPSNILEFVPHARIASMACFFHIRSQLLTDNAANLLIKLIHNMKTSADTKNRDCRRRVLIKKFSKENLQ